MNSFDSSLTSRAWQQNMRRSSSFPVPVSGAAAPPDQAHHLHNNNSRRSVLIKTSFSDLMLGEEDHDLVSSVVPPVTVVLEGRSICHRINLHKHSSYKSLARALRQMFVDDHNDDNAASTTTAAAAAADSENDYNLSNAIPGHLIAYQDMENDLLLAGDLDWKDFVRVAKRIRILPEKVSVKKGPKGRGHN